MKTIGEIIQLSADYLAERKIEKPKRLAEELLSHVLKMKKMDLYLQYDRPVLESELSTLRELLKRCAKGEPFEYVVGEVEFFGCKIQVNPNVLIPRPETELLVELISKRVKNGVLWEICTGSGYIAVALKKLLPELTVVASDICPKALAVAKENAKLNQVQIEFLEGDLLAPFKGRKADFIVCNPPYISDEEFTSLDPSVRGFEPKLALIGGKRGTEFYERLQREIPPFLNAGAKLFFEIGAGQGEAIKQIFDGKGEVNKDYAGHPRFFFLENL